MAWHRHGNCLYLVNTYIMKEDEYKIISKGGLGDYREKGSKFPSYSYILNDVADLDPILSSLKKEHPKARHFCYGYRLSPKSDQYRANDDGEPRGTAGLPIYNQILAAECFNVLVVVVRYFGGTKLGASGLTKAYKTSAEDCLKSSEFEVTYDTKKCVITYDYRLSGPLQDLLKSHSIKIINHEYNLPPKMTVELRASNFDLQIRHIKSGLLGRPLEDIKDDTIVPDIDFEV